MKRRLPTPDGPRSNPTGPDIGGAIQRGARDGTLYTPPSQRGLEKPQKPLQRKPGVRKRPVWHGKRNPYRRA